MYATVLVVFYLVDDKLLLNFEETEPGEPTNDIKEHWVVLLARP